MTHAQATFLAHPTRRRPDLAPVLVAWLLFLLPPPAESVDTSNQMATPPVFYVGMSKACFRDVNRNDATAAYRVFLERSGLRFGDVYKAEPEVFEDAPAFEAAIRQTPMRMAVIEAWQFLEMDIRRTMRPFFAVMENGKVGRKYLVLTRRSGGLRTLADLRGKAILELEVASANVGRAWLDTRLLSERLGTQRTFFERVEVVGKPTAAVLPVFFGKKPACVVDEPSFEVMTELNPQVGQALQAVAVSESFADVVVCLREDGWATEKSKSNTVEALSELHLNPVGQQICTLFKIDRMVPFQETQLDTIRSLRTTYESLRKESTP